jgi:ATP-dependent DNA ligase
MGVDKGRGRRSNTFGSFLFGTLYKNKIIPICKVGTGLSDLDLYELTNIANKLIIATPP